MLSGIHGHTVYSGLLADFVATGIIGILLAEDPAVPEFTLHVANIGEGPSASLLECICSNIKGRESKAQN